MNASENRSSAVPIRTVDLNADLGEDCPNDRALLELVTSASISCGSHAGSFAGIRQTLSDAGARGIVVGAHPGYADRTHFGRREHAMTSEAVRELILEQFAALSALAGEVEIAIRFLKPHGALYNQAQSQPEIARGVVAAAVELGIPLLGQPHTLLEKLASAAEVRYIAEGFPDRRYRDDGSLVPRSQPGALIQDPGEMRDSVLRLMADGRVATLCIHGDDPHAVENAQHVRRILDAQGVPIASFLRDEESGPGTQQRDHGT